MKQNIIRSFCILLACSYASIAQSNEIYKKNLQKRMFTLLAEDKIIQIDSLPLNKQSFAFQVLHSISSHELSCDFGSLVQCFIHNPENPVINKIMKTTILEVELGNDESGIRSIIEKFINGQKKKNSIINTKPFQVLQPARSNKIYKQKISRPLRSGRVEIRQLDIPFLGNEDAPVSVIVFMDYQCGFCKILDQTLNKLMALYPQKIRIGIMHSPIKMRAEGILMAEAALCANKVGKFGQTHKWLLSYQGKVTIENIVTSASKLGIDSDYLKDTLENHSFRSKVEVSKKEGERLGIKGTPTAFVNGIRVIGARSIEVFKKIIEKEIKLL